MSAESPPAPDYLRPPQGEAGGLHVEFDQQPESLFDLRKDTVINLYGMEGTIGDLIEFCPIDPSQMSMEAKDTFVAKALHASGEEVPEAYQHMVPELAEKMQGKQPEPSQAEVVADKQPEQEGTAANATEAIRLEDHFYKEPYSGVVDPVAAEIEPAAVSQIDVVALDLLQARLEAQKLLDAQDKSAESVEAIEPESASLAEITIPKDASLAEQTSSHKKQAFSTKLPLLRTFIEQFTKPVVAEQTTPRPEAEAFKELGEEATTGAQSIAINAYESINVEPERTFNDLVEAREAQSTTFDDSEAPQLFGEDSVIALRHIEVLEASSLSLPELAVAYDEVVTFEPLLIDTFDDLPDFTDTEFFNQLMEEIELPLDEYAEAEFWQSMLDAEDDTTNQELATEILESKVDGQPLAELLPPTVQERVTAFEATAEPEEVIVLQSLTLFVEHAAKNLQEMHELDDGSDEQLAEAQVVVEQLYDQLLQHIGTEDHQERQELIEQFLQALEAQSLMASQAEDQDVAANDLEIPFDFNQGTREYKRATSGLTRAVRRLSHKITLALGRHAVAPLEVQTQS